MRLGVLIDGRVARWQLQALERINADHEIYLLVSTPHPSPRSPKHALYYALSLFTVRYSLTRAVEVPQKRLNVQETISFSPRLDGAWAVLPQNLLDWIADRKLDAIVKFGLGLLRVPSPDQLSIPILSYHHGDPRKYRGRPAGFYEMFNKEAFLGQIVQALGGKLDGGTVYAFAESRIIPHSYRKTLMEAYRLSPYLLEQALERFRIGQPIEMVPQGPNYRLPSHGTVVRFCASRMWQAVRRAFYAGFIEKRWRVATATVGSQTSAIGAVEEADAAQWSTLPVGPGYRFYADPFFGSNPSEIFVEALNGRTGKGEVVRVLGDCHQTIRGFQGHVSYPAAVLQDGRRLLVPETTDWCPLTAFDVSEDQAKVVSALMIDEPAILDPTFVRHGGRIYLFGNTAGDGPNILHLWHADDLFSRFERHAASPIRVSARGSRMAGEVAEWDGQLYRFGQDWRSAYGDGILAFRIKSLSEKEYAEELVGEASFTNVRGPHTVNRRGTQLLFDYYSEGFSLLAGVRRLAGRL